jgi:hypothetical protein
MLVALVTRPVCERHPVVPGVISYFSHWGD